MGREKEVALEIGKVTMKQRRRRCASFHCFTRYKGTVTLRGMERCNVMLGNFCVEAVKLRK